MEEFKAWLQAEQWRHLPNGPMGEAIRYVQAALRTLSFSCSNDTRKKLASVITSQIRRKSRPLRASTSAAIAATMTLKWNHGVPSERSRP